MNTTQMVITRSQHGAIKVAVNIPDNVPETVRQRKINAIYEIFSKAEKRGCNSAANVV